VCSLEIKELSINNLLLSKQASLRGPHRQAKKHHHEDIEVADDEQESSLDSGKQSAGDKCHDEDDFDKDNDPCNTMRPKSNKQPTCPTTKRCTATRKCPTTSSCKSLDGLLNNNLDGGRATKMKYRKLNSMEDRVKQRPNLPDFDELSMDQDQNNIDSLKKLAAEAHQDQIMSPKHVGISPWVSWVLVASW